MAIVIIPKLPCSPCRTLQSIARSMDSGAEEEAEVQIQASWEPEGG